MKKATTGTHFVDDVRGSPSGGACRADDVGNPLEEHLTLRGRDVCTDELGPQLAQHFAAQRGRSRREEKAEELQSSLDVHLHRL